MSKKLIVPMAAVLLALSCTTATVQAAPPTGAPGVPAQQAPQDPLNLTAAQKTKLQSIGKAAQAQFMSVKLNAKLSNDAKATQLAGIITKTEADQRAVLDANQQKKFDAIQAQRKISDPFHLSPIQQVKLELMSEDVGLKTRAIIDTKGLSLDQRANQVDALLKSTVKTRAQFLDARQQKLYEEQEPRAIAQDPLHRTRIQRIKLRIIQTDARSQADQVMANKTLSQQQKMAKVAAIQANMEKQGQGVLTPAQVAKEKAMMKSMAPPAGAPGKR
ncbi:MAG TPA: hypothetical protein VGK19_20895 [Capsulimonadaceae bacterium]